MQKTSPTEENYLKAIYKHSKAAETVATNTLAAELRTTPASVTDMLKKLSDKGLAEHQPYKGVVLTPEGLSIALQIIRKHRLWETFLVEKLKFTWDEVHETAEQLEHIDSPNLISKLDEFLEFPEYDPHGDPIPDHDGTIKHRESVLLSQCRSGQAVTITGVLTEESRFLQFLQRLNLIIGQKVVINEEIPFDNSLSIRDLDTDIIINRNISDNIRVYIDVL